MNHAFLVAKLVAAICGLAPEEAMRTAQQLGTYAGYTGQFVSYEFSDPPGKQGYPGFISIQLTNNGHDAFDMSFDERTGRVYDFTKCLVFEYPVSSLKGKLSTRPPNPRSVMEAHGCVRYKILRRPNDEARSC